MQIMQFLSTFTVTQKNSANEKSEELEHYFFFWNIMKFFPPSKVVKAATRTVMQKIVLKILTKSLKNTCESVNF